MQSVIYKVGKKIFPLFNKLENKPKAKLLKAVVSNTSSSTSGDGGSYYNPYEINNDGTPNSTTQTQYQGYLFPVIHSFEPELITNGNQVITKKREVFIFSKEDLLEKGIDQITLNDLIEFPYYDEPPDNWNYTPEKYRITGVMDLMALIKVYTEKISI